MIDLFTKKIKTSYFIRTLYYGAKRMQDKIKYSRGTTIADRGCSRLFKEFVGRDNRIEIGEGSYLVKPRIRIHGDRNTIRIGNKVSIGKGCSIWVEGNGIEVNIGSCTSFTENVHICAQEDGMRIDIGEDCMLSNNIIIRTSDSHPIYDPDTSRRTNPPAPVTIGNHVWIAPHSTIMKGVAVGDGAIIGSHSLVTKNPPPPQFMRRHSGQGRKAERRMEQG